MLSACGSHTGSGPPPAPGAALTPEPHGPTTRGAIIAAEPAFEPARASAPDSSAALGLAQVSPGAEVTVVLGTWCGDSRRGVSRWFRALDLAGQVPFTVHYLAVDRAKEGPGTSDLAIEYVPTFIVSRDGAEVGRVVESAPQGIEVAVLELLTGETSGTISGRGSL